MLRSVSSPAQIYSGITEDLPQRIDAHNRGRSFHTKKYKPWECVVVVRFADESKARKFEKYLKTGSGRAFASRHLL